MPAGRYPVGQCDGSSADDCSGFPDGSRPEVRFDKLSSLCSTGLNPLIMTGALRQILVQYFADPDNVRSAFLRRYLEREGAWKEGDDTVGLYIESLTAWRPELTEARPAIVIKENDWEWMRVGIGDQSFVDYRDGKAMYAGYWKGTHTVFAIGNEGAETLILAVEIAKLLLWFHSVIQEQLNLHRFIVMSISGVHALKESTENYVVAVTIGYVVEEVWDLQQEAPRLKRIVFNPEEFLGL